MSAYIVDDSLINSILNFIRKNRIREITEGFSYKFCKDFIYSVKKPHTTEELLQLLGQRLVDYNYKSVNNKYKNDQQEPHQFSYVPEEKTVSVAQFFALIDELDYQSCEADDYYSSDESVYWDIARLKDFGIRQVRLSSGY